MTTDFKETFVGNDDRARMLSGFLSTGRGTPGGTLIGYLDRATMEISDIMVLLTPEPDLDDEQNIHHDHVMELSEKLREVGIASAPPWTRDGPYVTGELITVVCREGEPTISPTEMQYWWGWRYSNHCTTALHGDIYVVTPQGWAALVGDWSGSEPRLPGEASS